MTIKLRNEAYKTEAHQTEFEYSGNTSGMWGFVGSMNHGMAFEDRDKLFTHVCINNTDLKDVVIGELYILWEFLLTDLPIQSIEATILPFIFNPISIGRSLETARNQVIDVFRKVVKKKKEMKHVGEILNQNNIIMSSTAHVNLESDQPVTSSTSSTYKAIDYSQNSNPSRFPALPGLNDL